MRLNHARCACTQVLVLLPIDSGPSHEKKSPGNRTRSFPQKEVACLHTNDVLWFHVDLSGSKGYPFRCIAVQREPFSRRKIENLSTCNHFQGPTEPQLYHTAAQLSPHDVEPDFHALTAKLTVVLRLDSRRKRTPKPLQTLTSTFSTCEWA